MVEIKHFRRGGETRSYNCEDGRILATIDISGRWHSNPFISFFCSETGFVEYTPAPEPPYVPTRSEKINAEIRAKYTDNDENMILRHYAVDPVKYGDEFRAYNSYVESVIAKYPKGDE